MGCTYTGVVLEQDFTHKLFEDFGHSKSASFGQWEEALRLGQQPRLIGCENDKGHRGRAFLQGLLHDLDEVPMLTVSINYVGHDQNVEFGLPPIGGRGQIGKKGFDRVAPFVAFDIEPFPRFGGLGNQVGGQIGIVLHILHQLRVIIVGHDHGTSALNGAHDTRNTGRRADLKNVLVSDQLVGMLLNVV